MIDMSIDTTGKCSFDWGQCGENRYVRIKAKRIVVDIVVDIESATYLTDVLSRAIEEMVALERAKDRLRREG